VLLRSTQSDESSFAGLSRVVSVRVECWLDPWPVCIRGGGRANGGYLWSWVVDGVRRMVNFVVVEADTIRAVLSTRVRNVAKGHIDSATR
jgi:hypothetical protein